VGIRLPEVNKVSEAYSALASCFALPPASMQSTENCAGRREFVAPESGYSFERQIEIAEGFNVHRRQNRSIRTGQDVKGLRSQQAVACTKRCIQELGRSIKALQEAQEDD